MIKHILLATTALLLACSCSDDLYSPLHDEPESDQFTVSFGVNLGPTAPNVGNGRSRAFSDELDTYNNTSEDDTKTFGETEASTASIFVLAFDENHLLTDVYQGKYNGYEIDGEGDYHFKYTITFNRTAAKRILHVIVNHNRLAEDNLFQKIPFATESDIFNSDFMVVYGTDHDVYWRRLEFDNGIDETTTKARLNGLKLIRNFAKLRLRFNFADASEYKADYFDKIEWGLMCIPTQSTVAPYLKEQEFATFIHETNNTTADYTYDELYNEGYRCHVSRTTANANTYYKYPTTAYCDSVKWQDWYRPLYVYENEGSSESATWKKLAILVKMTTKGTATLPSETWYYRITLADPDRNNETLNIMRNVEYDINITEINTNGFDNPVDAFSRAPSNNVSGATSTSSFTNVNANNSGLRVEYTSRYILYPGNFTLQTRYIPDITAMTDGTYVTKNDCIELHSTEPYGKNEAEPAFMGDDHAKYAISNYTIDSEDLDTRYRVINFTANTPQLGGVSTISSVRVRINDPSKPENVALFRDVKFILRSRYLYKDMVITNDGEDENGDRNYQLTVSIPANMPELLFPLSFTFEAEPDCVFPNADKSVMVVNSLGDGLLGDASEPTYNFTRAVTREVYTGNSFETENGYKKVTFFFKLLKGKLNDGQVVEFAVWSNDFSADPDAEIASPTSTPITGRFTYDATTRTFTPL
jgi:hypothetical protein